eukprot:6105078-Pyramimonas_sp.AAC.1
MGQACFEEIFFVWPSKLGWRRKLCSLRTAVGFLISSRYRAISLNISGSSNASKISFWRNSTST